jgi:hypothetical protein
MLFMVVGTSAPPLHPTLREAARWPRRRRPTGAAPPLPYRLQTSGIGWLVAALVLWRKAISPISGPPSRWGLRSQAGLARRLETTNGNLADRDLVQLNDDRRLQPAENQSCSPGRRRSCGIAHLDLT